VLSTCLIRVFCCLLLCREGEQHTLIRRTPLLPVRRRPRLACLFFSSFAPFVYSTPTLFTMHFSQALVLSRAFTSASSVTHTTSAHPDLQFSSLLS
jgi:hypothetical protein